MIVLLKLYIKANRVSVFILFESDLQFNIVPNRFLFENSLETPFAKDNGTVTIILKITREET